MNRFTIAYWASVGSTFLFTSALLSGNKYAPLMTALLLGVAVIISMISFTVGFVAGKLDSYFRQSLTYIICLICTSYFISPILIRSHGIILLFAAITLNIVVYTHILAPRWSLSLAQKLMRGRRRSDCEFHRETSGFSQVMSDAEKMASLPTAALVSIAAAALCAIVLILFLSAATLSGIRSATPAGTGALGTVVQDLAITLSLAVGALLMLDILATGQFQRVLGSAFLMTTGIAAVNAAGLAFGDGNALLAAIPAIPSGLALFFRLWRHAIERRQRP